jgi:hypothetical protein
LAGPAQLTRVELGQLTTLERALTRRNACALTTWRNQRRPYDIQPTRTT